MFEYFGLLDGVSGCSTYRIKTYLINHDSHYNLEKINIDINRVIDLIAYLDSNDYRMRFDGYSGCVKKLTICRKKKEITLHVMLDE